MNHFAWFNLDRALDTEEMGSQPPGSPLYQPVGRSMPLTARRHASACLTGVPGAPGPWGDALLRPARAGLS